MACLIFSVTGRFGFDILVSLATYVATVLAGLGIFGDSASGDVGDDAPLQTRFLDLVGRRP